MAFRFKSPFDNSSFIN